MEFRNWDFSNLEWSKPKLIDVPTFSTKERLHLQKVLPCAKNDGESLYAALKYLIAENLDLREYGKARESACHYLRLHCLALAQVKFSRCALLICCPSGPG